MSANRTPHMTVSSLLIPPELYATSSPLPPLTHSMAHSHSPRLCVAGLSLCNWLAKSLPSPAANIFLLLSNKMALAHPFAMRRTYKPVSRAERTAQIFKRKTLNLNDDLNIRHDDDNIENIEEYWETAVSVIGNRTIDSMDGMDDTVLTEQSDTLFDLQDIRRSIKEPDGLYRKAVDGGTTTSTARPPRKRLTLKPTSNDSDEFIDLSTTKENDQNIPNIQAAAHSTEQPTSRAVGANAGDSGQDHFQDSIGMDFADSSKIDISESVIGAKPQSRGDITEYARMARNNEHTGHAKQYVNQCDNRHDIQRDNFEPADSFETPAVSYGHAPAYEASVSSAETEACHEQTKKGVSKEDPMAVTRFVPKAASGAASRSTKSAKAAKAAKSAQGADFSLVVQDTRSVAETNKIKPLVCTEEINTAIMELDYLAFTNEDRADRPFSIYVVRGKVFITTGGRERLVKKGEATVIGNQQEFSIRCPSVTGASLFLSYAL